MVKVIPTAAIRLSILLAAMIGGAALVGQQRPLPPSIVQLRLTDCLPPCWVGIMPGLTTIADAQAKLAAAFVDGNGQIIDDSSLLVPSNTIENRIEGDNFSLIVRLNTADIVDGKSEIVQSIDLFQSNSNGPTVGELLGTFGPPEGIVVEAFTSVGFEISLKFNGLSAGFYTNANRVALNELTHIILEKPGTQTFYRPWIGFRTLDLKS